MQEKASREIVVFLTGGTIAMRSGPLGAVPADTLKDCLMRALASSCADVRFVQWASKPSPHVTPPDMFQLAQDVAAELKKDFVLGAVVLHGTDLLAETAFVLDRVLTSDKPVVCTGAMRHMEEAGYDGIRNVLYSVLACLAMPSSSEVLVQIADFLYTASDAVKVDSASISPFTGNLHGAVGRIVDGNVYFSQPVQVQRPRLPFAVQGIAMRVPIVTCYAGMGSQDLLWACGYTSGVSDPVPHDPASNGATPGSGADGVVLMAFGAGNIPPGMLPGLETLLEQSIPVVLTSRCPGGGVLPLYGYEGGGGQLLSRGVIPAGLMSAYKAQLLLKMALSSGCPSDRLAEIFS